MRSFRTSLNAIALAAQAGSARAQEDDVLAILPISADPATCNLDLATKVSLLSIAGDPLKWKGQCVAVDGYRSGNALFAAQPDAGQRYPHSSEQFSGRRVGSYGTEQVLASASDAGSAYTAVGIAGDCDTLAGGTAMVFGYCHYTDGAYIVLAEIRRL